MLDVPKSLTRTNGGKKVKTCGRITGEQQDDLCHLHLTRPTEKVKVTRIQKVKVCMDTFHPWSADFQQLRLLVGCVGTVGRQSVEG